MKKCSLVDIAVLICESILALSPWFHIEDMGFTSALNTSRGICL